MYVVCECVILHDIVRLLLCVCAVHGTRRPIAVSLAKFLEGGLYFIMMWMNGIILKWKPSL